MEKTSLEKRIKRQVTARKQTFFASCPPGLAGGCLKELKKTDLGLTDIQPVKGGVEFKGRVHQGYQANLYLHSPARITMRVASFKAENFRTLEKHLRKVPWELYLHPLAELTWEVTTGKSRLYHTGAIQERCMKTVRECLAAGAAQSGGGMCSHTLFARVENDRFVISLDASGERLHKRGIKSDVGRAPIRENLAWAILKKSGYSGETPLVDPMCGSGTFALEAVLMARKIPPGFFRNFAFEHWPCFSPARWNHIKKEAGEKFLSHPGAPILASDINPPDKLMASLEAHGMAHGVEVFKQDFFEMTPPRKKGVVVLNPPYGRRLGNDLDLRSFYRKIGKKLAEDFKGWRAGVVLPEKALAGTLPFAPSLSPFFHGGLELHAAMGIICG